MSDKLGAQQNAIVNGPFEGRNCEAIQTNFEKIFRRLKAFDGGLLGVPQDAEDGDIIYFEDGEWKSLAIGSSSQALQVVSGLPAWATIPEQRDYMGLVAQNQWAIFGRLDGATLQRIGIAAPSITGTQALANQTDSTYVSETTAGGAGAGAAVIGVAGAAMGQHDPIFNIIMRTDTITNCRLFFGLTNANFTNADTPGGASQYVAFRFSAATDSGWVGICRDGATPQTTAQVAAIAGTTRYKLTIRVNTTGTAVAFSVNDGAEVSLAVNLPAITTNLFPWLGVFSTGAPTNAWFLSRAHCRYGS